MLDEKQAKMKAKEVEKLDKEKRLQKLKSQVIHLFDLEEKRGKIWRLNIVEQDLFFFIGYFLRTTLTSQLITTRAD